jgi:hypothetical protein
MTPALVPVGVADPHQGWVTLRQGLLTQLGEVERHLGVITDPQERTCWVAMRQGYLIQLAAVERHLGIEPTRQPRHQHRQQRARKHQ